MATRKARESSGFSSIGARGPAGCSREPSSSANTRQGAAASLTAGGLEAVWLMVHRTAKPLEIFDERLHPLTYPTNFEGFAGIAYKRRAERARARS